MKEGLFEWHWKQSEIDYCLFTKNGILLIVYVDHAILISLHKDLIDTKIKYLQEDYVLTDDGELMHHLGTRFRKHSDRSIEFSQPRMIERVLETVLLDDVSDCTNMHDTPAVNTELIDNDPDGAPHLQLWNYHSIVGTLSYLQAMVFPDITFAVQKCARLCNNTLQQHEEAVKRICCYLLRTKNKGLIIKPDKYHGLECFVNADWAGPWKDRSSNDPSSAHSRYGYVIMYAGCPIIWASNMHYLILLRTTEAEYIALSSSLH